MEIMVYAYDKIGDKVSGKGFCYLTGPFPFEFSGSIDINTNLVLDFHIKKIFIRYLFPFFYGRVTIFFTGDSNKNKK